MNAISCIPGAENAELWKTVASQLSDYPSLLDVFHGDNIPSNPHSGETSTNNVEAEDVSESHNDTLSGRSKRKSSSCEQLKAYQRRLLTCLNESPCDLNHLQMPHADLQVLTSSPSLVVPEDTFQAACQQAVGLEEDHVGWVAQFILLPMVSQLSGPLTHPCQQQLSALVEQHSAVLTNSCLCPALRWGCSSHTDQLVAALLDRLPTVMITRGAALLRSLISRERLEEGALVVVESAGVALPTTSTTSSLLAAEAVVTALETLCASLPADSSRVGRVLLRLTHKLAPYLADNTALRRQFAQTVEGHASPLQRPIKMKLVKIS